MMIGELAASLGVSTKTLRLYEERGLIPKPQRARNGYRVYAPDAARKARLVVSLRALGLSLDEIEQLAGAFGRKDRSLRRELSGVLHERMRVLSEEIAVRQGQFDDLSARYLALIDTPHDRTGDCVCGATNQVCHCGAGSPKR
jgi:DNA-binding transcriptional MerR regulator